LRNRPDELISDTGRKLHPLQGIFKQVKTKKPQVSHIPWHSRLYGVSAFLQLLALPLCDKQQEHIEHGK
jgi:hypothetical protein